MRGPARRDEGERDVEVSLVHGIRVVGECAVNVHTDRSFMRRMGLRLVGKDDVEDVFRRPSRTGQDHSVTRLVVVLVGRDRIAVA